MNEPIPGQCYICGQHGPVHCIELYTVGSEATWLCATCRLLLTEFARCLHAFRYRAMFTRRETDVKATA